MRLTVVLLLGIVIVSKGLPLKSDTVPASTTEIALFNEGLKWYRKYDYSRAFPWFKKAAEQGDKNAQVYVGIMSYYGLGTQQNYTDAVKWFKMSSRQGNAEAESRLGGTYYGGLGGLKVDWTESLRLYRAAAKQADPRGMARLGCMLHSGEGTIKNDPAATRLFLEVQEQANRGNAEAQYQLGFLYYTGIGFNQNYKEALGWYLKAERQGHVECRMQLANIYEYGRGVARNKSEAIEWYRKVIDLGPTNLWYEAAAKALKRLKAD